MPGSASHDEPSRRYPWKVVGVALSGTYLIAINTTALGVALPAIAEDIGAGGAGADWILTAYLMALAVSMPISSWLADRLGRRHAYSASLAVFLLGVGLSALAPNLPVLLLGRTLQGLGGGPLLPIGVTMLYEQFPPERRGFVLGVWGVGIAAAPAVGPPLGGWLVTSASWRWIFAVLFVGAVIALVTTLVVLRDLVPRRPVPFDFRGWITASVSLTCLVIVTREGGEIGYGAPVSLGLIAASLVAGTAFVRISRRQEDPILDVRVFRSPIFSLAMVLMSIFALGQYARLNFLPIELQIIRGLSAFEVGLLLIPAAIAVGVLMPVGGALGDRFGPRPPIVAGLACMTVSMFGLATLTPATSVTTLYVILVGQGMGSGLVFSPAMATALAAVPGAMMPQASTLTQLNRQVSATVGTAVMAALITASLGSITPRVSTVAQAASAQAGYNRMFLITTFVLASGTLMAFALPGRQRIAALQRDRAVDHAEFIARVADSHRHPDAGL